MFRQYELGSDSCRGRLKGSILAVASAALRCAINRVLLMMLNWQGPAESKVHAADVALRLFSETAIDTSGGRARVPHKVSTT